MLFIAHLPEMKLCGGSTLYGFSTRENLPAGMMGKIMMIT